MKNTSLLSIIPAGFLLSVVVPATDSRAEDQKPETVEKAAGSRPATEKEAIQQFQTRMAAVKIWWVEATEAARSGEAAAHRLPGQLQEKISQVRTAGLPADVVAAFREYAGAVKEVAELYREMPEEDAAGMAWMAKKLEEAQFQKDRETAQARLMESAQVLRQAGARYGVEKEVDFSHSAGGAEADPRAFLSGESLGGIALDAPAAAVLNKLGDPPKIGKDERMEATGDWVQEWSWPKKGLTLQMGSTKPKGAKTVFSMMATAGCLLETARGIKVGSPAAAVRKAYQEVEDKENAGEAESFVAGSIYGGVIFTMKDGKVTDIFIGAAAE